MNITLSILDAVYAAIGASLVAGIIKLALLIIQMSKSLDELIHSDNRKSLVLAEIAAVQQPQLHGIQVSLEAHKGECNGNVETAHAVIVAARTKYERFLADNVGNV